jgi:hypothetical protein
MRKLFTALTLALSATWASAGPVCSLSDVSVTLDTDPVTTADAAYCGGSWSGNSPTTLTGNVGAFLTSFFPETPLDPDDPFGFTSSWTYQGKSDQEGEGPFTNVGDGSSGFFTFDVPQTGVFALVLKSSNEHSAYIFDIFDFAIGGEYSTVGVAVNRRSIPQGLSHMDLWTWAGGNTFGGGICDINPAAPGCTDNPVNEVPEPTPLALAGLGLLAAGVVTRRRKV